MRPGWQDGLRRLRGTVASRYPHARGVRARHRDEFIAAIDAAIEPGLSDEEATRRYARIGRCLDRLIALASRRQ